MNLPAKLESVLVKVLPGFFCCNAKNCRVPRSQCVSCTVYDWRIDLCFGYWYCTDHAMQEGYCYMCGNLCAGVETYDFPESYGVIRGMCQECSEETKANMGEYDEYYEGYRDDDGHYLLP